MSIFQIIKFYSLFNQGLGEIMSINEWANS